MNYKEIVQTVIEKHKDLSMPILGRGDPKGEYRYLNLHKDSYIRTIRDIDGLFKQDRNKKILEIGSFLGPVSISLKKLGYSVCALDIPERYQSAPLRALYKNHGVEFIGVNLKEYKLPYESSSFDTVIICEVIEHLNFNPLPVLKEINRVLKNNGYLYIGMPNLLHIYKRAKLLLGGSFHNPIGDFFKQLDEKDNLIVGIHWREYTINETIQMIERMGFKVIKKYFFITKGYKESKSKTSKTLKALFRTLAYTIPSFRPLQVVIGKKVLESNHDFWLTDATS